MTVASVQDMIVQTETTLNLAEMERVEKERERLAKIEDIKWELALGFVAAVARSLEQVCQLAEHSYTLEWTAPDTSKQYANGYDLRVRVHADDAWILTGEGVSFDWGSSSSMKGTPGVSLVDSKGVKVSGLPDFLRALRRATEA